MADPMSEYFAEFDGQRHFYYEPWRTNDWRKKDNFNALAQAMGWDPRAPRRNAEYRRVQEIWIGVVEAEFAGNSLTDYQQLCQELSFDPIPDSIPECKKMLSKVWVNVIDLVQYRRDERAGRLTEPVEVFYTFEKFEKYTKDADKWYPSGSANGEMLKVLLKQR
jgi:hypothetical protein